MPTRRAIRIWPATPPSISWLLGRKLTLDPAKEMFVGDDEANRFRSRTYREPWCL